jgi:FSR family fosmidomycin resistance protein-like MFS transporter
MSRFVLLLERFPFGAALVGRRLRAVSAVFLLLVSVDYLDEVVFGLREAAWPLIRDDLSLTYFQVGLVLSVPGLIAAPVEVALGALADIGHRRRLILGGGALFSFSLVVIALSPGFAVLLAASVLLYPASGALVGLSQAALMDSDPARHEQNMARWTFSGSIGVVSGSLALAAGAWAGIGWRTLFMAGGVAAAAVTLLLARASLPRAGREDEAERASFRGALAEAARSMRRKSVLRWLVLLQFSDLMLDVLLGFLALYFVDVTGASVAQAAVAVAVWTVVGLAGDFALIPLLERVRGVVYLRVSAAATAAAFTAFLLAPGIVPKMALLGVLGLLNAGWYSILQARLYSELPGRSGSVVSITAAASVAVSVLPLALGALAGAVGLQAMMWVLLVSPVALFLLLPRQDGSSHPAGEWEA